MTFQDNPKSPSNFLTLVIKTEQTPSLLLTRDSYLNISVKLIHVSIVLHTHNINHIPL